MTTPVRELADSIARRTGGGVIADPAARIETNGDVLLLAGPDAIPRFERTEHRGWSVLSHPVSGDATRLQHAVPNCHFNGVAADGTTLVIGPNPPPTQASAPPGYRALAIMTAYNESDIIEAILDRAANEGLEVHFIDNWSTDDTLDRASEHPAVTTVERFPSRRPSRYEWEQLLRRVEVIAADTRADWVVHHDADEWRQSPWRGVRMVDALSWVAAAGYNAVDHTVVFHPPTDDRLDSDIDVTRHLTRFEFASRVGHFTQIKSWRPNLRRVDLGSSGGHEARFEDRRVFPVNFLLRHYPIRSQSHGIRKVLQDRRPRWSRNERSRGWHNQYDDVGPETNFLQSQDDLPVFDERTFYEEYLFQRLARIGIAKETRRVPTSR